MSTGPLEPTYVDGALFLGRVEEQKQFRHILQDMLTPPPDETLPYIILLYGDGGIGKTTLARRFWQIANGEEPFAGAFHSLWLDWEELRRRTPALQMAREQISPETVLDLLYKTAVNQWGDKSFKLYAQAVRDRAEAETAANKALEREGERDELAAKISGLGTAALAKLVRLTLPVGEGGEAATKTLLDAGVELGAGGAATLRAALTERLQRKLNPEQFRLFLSPHEHLARALGRDLQGVTQGWRGKSLLIALDTYEIVDHNDIWLREVMKAAGATVAWVVSGRDNLADSRFFGGANFIGYRADFPRRLQAYNLGELALADLQTYFAHEVPERPLSEADALALVRATRGIPLAMGEAAAIWRRGTALADIVGEENGRVSHQQIVERMTERYLRYALESEADRVALYALALAEGDIDQLQAMLQPEGDASFDLEARLAQLARNYASVHLQQARLHDAATQFIQAYLRVPLRRQGAVVRRLNEQRTAVLRARLAKCGRGLLLEERCDDEDWQQTAAALTSALFWLDDDQAWRWLIPGYVAGLAYSRALRRNLVQTAQVWRETFNAAGRKRLKLLQEGEGLSATSRQAGGTDSPLSPLAALKRLLRESKGDDGEAERDLLTELHRLARTGWLTGEDEAELRAILAWRHGKNFYRQKQYESALAAYQQVEPGLPPEGEKLRTQLAADLYELSNQFIWPDKAPSSIPTPAGLVASQLAVALDATHGGAHYNYAVVLDAMGEKETAVAMYHKAIAIEPRATRYYGLGTVYSAQGRYEAAIAAYQQAITLDPNYAYPHNGLGNVYSDQGRYEAAIAAYQQAITLDPKLASPHNNLAGTYLSLGQFAEAEHHFQERVRLEPDTALSALVNLGVLARHQGRRAESDAYFHRALSVWERAWQIRYQTPFALLENKAVILLCLGQSAKALTTLQEGLAQKLPGDVIERGGYDLLLAAPEPPEGVAEMLSLLGY